MAISESLDIERFHFGFRTSGAPSRWGGGAPPNVYNRRRVRLES